MRSSCTGERKRKGEATLSPWLKPGGLRAEGLGQRVIARLCCHPQGAHDTLLSIFRRVSHNWVSDIWVWMVYSVKQLTVGFCCITVWHRSGFTSAFAPGEQKKLNGLTLNQRVLGSSPRGLNTPRRNGSGSFRSLFCFLTHSASKSR
jgi:hypothetical protein